jgi:sulfoxide reductase heme-binding subunit YedZ
VINALWYLGRGTGVVALVLLTVSVTLGIATRSGRAAPGLPRFAVAELHRNASLLATVFLVLHVGSLLFDPYAQLRLADLVLPFDGRYRPFWLGLGTLGLDLIAALVVTSLLRHRIGRRTWRAVHWAAYLTWPFALAHALGEGSDGRTIWFLAVAGICFTAAAIALAWRLSAEFAERRTASVPIPEVRS